MLKNIRCFILGALFPPHCVACNKNTRTDCWFCEDCLGLIEIIHTDPCSACGSVKREHDCKRVGDVQLTSLTSIGYYHDPRLRALIRSVKYRYVTKLAPTLDALVRRYTDTRRDPWPWAGESAIAIQPVIGSPERIRARGFDQAAMVGECLRRTVVPWGKEVSLLSRSSSMSTQADLAPGVYRKANVKDAFHIRKDAEIPEAVLLTDDVFTTGATMQEAARVLREAGVKRVYGFTLALGA